MAFTPIIENVVPARDPLLALDVQAMSIDSANEQVNAEIPLTRRRRGPVLLGEVQEVETAKPRIAHLLRSSIGASLQ